MKLSSVYAVFFGAVLALGVGAVWYAPAEAAPGRWRPEPGTSWQWQLSSPPDELLDVDAYDVDGFDTSAKTVARIHAGGAKAICYVNVGAWERWRPDRGKFPEEVLGKAYDGWPGERWLDIRRLDALGPIMAKRMDVCQRKGFDAVEPDNMDGHTNKTGFRITSADQLRYNRWLARAAHRRGLSIAMKNDEAQVGALVDLYDFAITEDCFDGGWCKKMSPFVARGKAVLAAEYTDTGARPETFCGRAEALRFDAILKKRGLGAWRRSC